MVAQVPSYATQEIVLGDEAIYGTPVVPDKKLLSMRIPPQPNIETDPFTPSGATAPAVVSINDYFTEAQLTGRLDYNGVIFPAGSIFGAPVSSQPDAVNSPTVWEHLYTWDGKTPIAPIAYTAIYGRTGRAYQIPGFVFNAMNFMMRRTGIDFGGSAFGKKLTPGATFPPTPTDVEPVPVFPLHCNVYVDDLWADLGDTQMLFFYGAGLTMNDRLGRTRPVNRSQSSDGIVETEDQSHPANFIVGVDATLDEMLGDLRAGTRKFVRFEALGPIIEDAFLYEIRWDTCITLTGADAFGGEQGAHALPLNGIITRDPVSGFASRLLVRNKLAAV